jgi:cytochrome c oxidase subunit 2
MALPPGAALPTAHAPAHARNRANEATGYRMMNKRLIGAVLLGMAVAAVALAAVWAGPVLADQPHPWQMWMQDPATPVDDRLVSLHGLLLVLITVITLFVLGLLLYTMTRFRASRHPTPTRTAHNTTIEVLWTAIPVIILVVIAIPSLRLLYYQDRTHEAGLTLNVKGHQWYWEYTYPDQHLDQAIESRMVRDEDLQPGQLRLLEVDNRAVVPVDTNIRVLVTSNDVIHSFFVPSSGVQVYGIAGRTNETWLRFEHAGVYRGQCNQICGLDHARMPIVIEVVPREQFDRWVEEQRRAQAQADAPRPQLAAAPASDPDAR